MQTVAAVLRGQPLSLDVAAADRLVDLAIDHRVAGLLARTTVGRDLPSHAADRLKAYVSGCEVLTVVMDEEIARVLDALATSGVRVLVIKGAHLSHAIYPAPALRPRSDTDLIVLEADRERVDAALTHLGYERLTHVRGTVILGQFHFTRADRAGIVHALDVHWRVAAPLVFIRVLPFEVLRPHALPILALGAHAYGPSLSDALVLACIHLAAHHRQHPMLLWLYDLSLLAHALDERQQTAFVDTAGETGVTAICAKALDDARRYFDDPRLASLAARVADRGAGQIEPSAAILSAVRPIDELLLDLKTRASLRTRLTLLREHVWPDADYMRATGREGWLPVAYARRAFTGARKWLRPEARSPKPGA